MRRDRPDGADPTVLLDAGTGLTRVTRLLGGRPFRGTILLGHLHWDHTQGLPFFRSEDQDHAVVRLLLPAQEGGTAEELLARAMSPPHFPIRPSELRGNWSFDHVQGVTTRSKVSRSTSARSHTRVAARSATGSRQ